MRFRKPALILALVVLLFNSAIPQVFSQAQTTPALTPPQQCFKQDECATGKYKNSFAVASQECAAYPPYTYNCISSPPPVKLNTPLAGLTEITGLQNYIVIIYKFLIGSAGILAGIMIVIAGFEWLTAAGDSGKIKHARGKITNALIGLVLALGSYTILYTINPALLSLQMAPIKMFRQELIEENKGLGCKVGRDDALCNAKYPGAKCMGWQEASPDCTGWIIGATGGVTGGVIGAATAACIMVPGAQAFCLSALRAGGQFILRSGRFLLRTRTGNVILAAGGGTLVAYKMGLIGNTTAEEADGICVEPEKQGTKRPGEECSKGIECASGQCSNLTLCSPIAGVCTDGKKGSPCRVGETVDPKWICNAGLTCVQISTANGVSSYQFGSCSDGSWGFRCTELGFACADRQSICSPNSRICVKRTPADNINGAPQGEGQPCKTSYDCAPEGTTVTALTPQHCIVQTATGPKYSDNAFLSGDQSDLVGQCSSRGVGSECTPARAGFAGVSGCANNNVCISFVDPSNTIKHNTCLTVGELGDPCDPGNAFTTCNPRSNIECRGINASDAFDAIKKTFPDGTFSARGYCAKKDGQSCGDSNECANGSCVQGVCTRPRCTTDADCSDPQSMRCDVTSGVCFIR